MKKIYGCLLGILFVINSIGCSKVETTYEMMSITTEEQIINTLEEKYPEKTFEVVGQDGLHYNVVDEEGIEFQVEPLQVNLIHFWCRDNYLDAYFEANGIVEECNEVLEKYGVENRVEIGEPFEINLGVIDKADNSVQMAACLDELGELLQIPFEVTYYDKGTPQSGEAYQGSSKTGTFSYIKLDYKFLEAHIMAFVGEGTISISDIQESISGSDLINNINVQVEDYDKLGEAIDKEFYYEIKEAVAEGNRPVEVFGDNYRNFDTTIEMLSAKIKSNSNFPIVQVENEGTDEEGNIILHVTTEADEELILHIGLNEGWAYSYKLVDLYSVK